MRIRIRIQQLKLMRIHADPDPDTDPKPCLQLFLVVHDNGDIFMVRTQLSAILDVCLFILFKNFFHQ
jgi:hypothetical protein